MAAHWDIDVDAAGDHRIACNGDDVSHLFAGWSAHGHGRGQTPIVTLHAAGSISLHGDGIVQLEPGEASAADAQAEVAAVLDGLDPDEVWALAMADPDDTGGPCGMVLRTVRMIVCGGDL